MCIKLKIVLTVDIFTLHVIYSLGLQFKILHNLLTINLRVPR